MTTHEITNRIELIEGKGDIKDGEYYSVKYKDKYYVSSTIHKYLKLLSVIRDNNESRTALLVPQHLKQCKEYDLEFLVQLMSLQKEALSENGQGKIHASFADIAKMRILHHGIYAQVFARNIWNDFVGILRSHEVLKFDRVCRCIDVTKNDTLYVPKEAEATLNCMVNIVQSYIVNHAIRERRFYHPKITYSDGRFKCEGNDIKRIEFMFDTLQQGTSTIRCIDFYLKNCKEETVEENGRIHNNNSIQYFCSGNRVYLPDIIITNNPAIIITFMYGSAEGEKRVKEYLKQVYPSYKIEVNVIVQLNKQASADFIEKVKEIYKPSSREQSMLQEGEYPVIREFNQPKSNIFPQNLLNSDNCAAIFVKKAELH